MNCINPLTIVNPRFKKRYFDDNGRLYNNDVVSDAFLEKTLFLDMEHPDWYITVPCGHCRFCQKRIAREWRFRLFHEIGYYGKDNSYFVTFTVAPQYYDRVASNIALSIKQFRDRYRKATGEVLRYWIVPEIAIYDEKHGSGERSVGNGRGRLHFHGLLFGCKVSRKDLRNLWKYGNITRSRVKSASKCSSYVTDYVLKIRASGMFRVYCSPGIGKSFYTDSIKDKMLTDPGFYKIVLPDGYSRIIPRYYRDRAKKDYEKEIGDDGRLIYRLQHPPEYPWRLGSIIYSDYDTYLSDCQQLQRFEKQERKQFFKNLESIWQKYPYNKF